MNRGNPEALNTVKIPQTTLNYQIARVGQVKCSESTEQFSRLLALPSSSRTRNREPFAIDSSNNTTLAPRAEFTKSR